MANSTTYSLGFRVSSDGVKRGTSVIQRELGRVHKTTSALKSSFLGLGAALGVGLGASAALNTIRNFDKSMRTLQSLIKGNTDELKALGDEAKRLGGTTRYSASQAADAMVSLKRAGRDTNEVLSLTGKALSMATAEGMGLEEATSILNTTLNQFGLDAGAAGATADLLSTAASSANTTVSELAQALENAGPAANALEIGLKETLALLDVLADNGITAAKAGTTLRMTLNQLAGATGPAAKRLEDLGIDLRALNFKDPVASLTELRQALEPFSQQERFSIVKSIVGAEGATGVTVLMNNVDALREKLTMLGDATGEVDRKTAAMGQSIDAAVAQLKSVVESIVIDMAGGTDMAGAIRNFAGALRDLYDAVKPFSDLSKATIGNILDLMEHINPMDEGSGWAAAKRVDESNRLLKQMRERVKAQEEFDRTGRVPENRLVFGGGWDFAAMQNRAQNGPAGPAELMGGFMPPEDRGYTANAAAPAGSMQGVLTAVQGVNLALSETNEKIAGAGTQTTALQAAWEGAGLAVESYSGMVNEAHAWSYEFMGMFRQVENQIVQAFQTGKFHAEDFFQSILNYMAEIAMRKSVEWALGAAIDFGMGAMGGLAGLNPFGGGGGGGSGQVFDFAGEMATGGMTPAMPGPMSDGGYPMVLHPNEAVIPLGDGRKVPVEVRGGGSGGGVTIVQQHIYGVPDPKSFASNSKIQRGLRAGLNG